MKNIKDILDEKGMSQRELADKVGITEVSLSRYINGNRVPKAPIALNIARVLGVDVNELFDCGFERSGMESNYTIKVETEGMEEAQEQVELLADAYDGFPAQVTVKNCRYCTINIYPSQIRTVEAEGREE